MRTNTDVSLKEAIDTLLHTYKLKGKVYETRIVSIWPEIAGKVIDQHTLDLYLKNTTLHIRVDSAPLRQELMYSKTKVIGRINECLGVNVVEDIVLL